MAASMPPDLPLTAGVEQFIASIGVYFEAAGLPRLCGRLLGLLTVADRPLSLDDMASALKVSRASVSTNIRLAVTTGLAEPVAIPGDRRDYYRLGDDPWERRIRVGIDGALRLRAIAERGFAALPPDRTEARSRVQDLMDLCDISADVAREAHARWIARRRRREG